MTKILVLGVSGMLGHVLFKGLNADPRYEARGTARSKNAFSRYFTDDEMHRIYDNVESGDFDSLHHIFADFDPDVTINCIGIIKQLPSAKDAIASIAVNALFPHQLANLCQVNKSRMIHISSDCVFNGSIGNYKESDFANAEDLYGRTKLLGEVTGKNNTLTIRTSIIGHELNKQVSLVDWFLSQSGAVQGYTNAIYSGFPTVELLRIIADFVIPNPDLHGLYHISSAPIAKYDLLKYIAKYYKKSIIIEPYDAFKIDRSLNSDAFRLKTGYFPPNWEDMVEIMHRHFMSESCYHDKRGVFPI